jgi:shikimate dehydrogenase
MAKSDGKNAFVTGFPIKQSKSPVIHGYWLKQLGLNGHYKAVELKEDGFAAFLASIKSGELDFEGGNVTMPFKEEAFKRVDHLDDIAKKIGAVNTIYKKDGQLWGSNTDGYGFSANLDDFSSDWKPKPGQNKRAVVLGAGGASRAILYALADLGFKEVLLFNRTFERAKGLELQFGGPIQACDMADIDEGLQNADLFVNTSSLGMHGTDVPDLDFANMAKGGLVTDIVYSPLKTKFLQNAEQQGIKIADGFGMLLHQAVPGFEYWFGQRPKVTNKLRQQILSA